MIEINPSRFKSKPFAHQLEGIKKLVENEAFALFDEPGAGKSKQVIDAACTLAEAGNIDTVVIVAPASVRCVWLDAEIGEIKKHSWVESAVYEFHRKSKLVWEDSSKRPTDIDWIITNYEYLRGHHVEELIHRLGHRKTFLVLDESSYIKSRTAAQTKAVAKLRTHCAKCVMLNGTPLTQGPLDLWSQMQILSPKILASFKNFYNFRYEYCEMRSQGFGGRRFQQVVSYRRLDQLAKKVAPYVLRREKKDCLDLPPKLYTEREVALTPASWKRYQELRRDLLITLDSGEKQLEPNAAVRVMRLAQLTSGILGGAIQEVKAMESDSMAEKVEAENFAYAVVQDVSDEKLKWAVEYLTNECTAKAVIVWTRWRRERERIFEWYAKNAVNKMEMYQLYGGQDKKSREHAVSRFSSIIEEPYPIVLLAQPHAGSHGLNLIAATKHIFLSNDFSLGIRLQAEDRSHRPGQKHNLTIIDIIATGPQGQKTIDRTIFDALRNKQNIAAMTTREWRKELGDD